MKCRSALIALFVCVHVSAQSYDPDKVNPKAQKAYDRAIELLRDGALKEAIPLLAQAIKEDSNFVDAYLSMGGAMGQLKRYKESIQMYERGRAKDTAYFRVYDLPYSINLAGLGRFADALAAVNRFLTYPRLNERSIKSGEYRKRCYEFALQFAATHPSNSYVFNPQNLGDSVNTTQSEYYPSVTVTDSMLVFTRQTGAQREDFIESRIDNGKFHKWKLINGDINLETNKGALSVSQDGEWLIFAGQLLDQAHRSFDIYISYLTPQGWSAPQNMGTNVNSDFYESGPTLSPDKQALYFCSTRPGGYGGSDLYVCYRQPNGKWGPAQNMGPEINSAGDEQAPFMHADNQTLYYTSNGLPGYGESDLFIVRKKADGSWGKPENLGYPINTIENEGSLAVSADGLTAYYASDRSDSRGGLDLYRFELRPDIRPNRTLYVKGKVTDQKTGAALPSSVELIDNNTALPLMKVQTDELGQYFVTLPVGKDYVFTVKRKGYLFYSDRYNLQEGFADSVYHKDIALQPVALNAVSTFSNVLFATNSAVLPASAYTELDQLVQILNENPTLKLEISGHTDNTGIVEENNKLSTNRAKSIVDYLTSKGIDAARLSWKGYGSSQPVADNTTEKGRSLNRRTTFTITGL
jgi:outer membrane protein OmpA-like peptidoglycan-associated protein